METLTKAAFICTFEKIENYPFNSETCFFNMFISGTDNRFTRLEVISLQDCGKESVDQYEVKTWGMKNETWAAEGCRSKAAKGEIFHKKFLKLFLILQE